MRVNQDLLQVLVDVERGFSAMSEQDSLELDFYELLHLTASRIGTTDSFYVCLYDDVHQEFSFPYNLEGDTFDRSELKPLGNGPTSWVIRNRRLYNMDDDAGIIQHGGQNFGDMSRQSRSAIHAPMLATDWEGHPHVCGALSMQSYQPAVYSPSVILAFEWLALRSAAMFQRHWDLSSVRGLTSSLILQDQTNEVTRVLQDVTQQTEALYDALQDQNVAPRVHEAVKKLKRSCYRAQTRAAGSPFHRTSGSASNERTSDPFGLTDQERRVLSLLLLQRTNKQIATELSVAISTVKSHVTNVLQKLGVTRRGEAAQKAEALRYQYPEAFEF